MTTDYKLEADDCYIQAAYARAEYAHRMLGRSIGAGDLYQVARALCIALNNVRKAADNYGDAEQTVIRVATCKRIDALPKYATQDD